MFSGVESKRKLSELMIVVGVAELTTLDHLSASGGGEVRVLVRTAENGFTFSYLTAPGWRIEDRFVYMVHGKMEFDFKLINLCNGFP